MKVLWLAPHPLPNNDTNGKRMHPAPWITSLAEELALRGVEITIVTTLKRMNHEIQEFDMGAYKLVILNVPSGKIDTLTLFKTRIGKLQNYISNVAGNFDLVHVHGTEHQYATSLSGISIPYVISIQGLLYQYKKYISDRFTQRRLLWELGAMYEKNEIRKADNFMCRTHWDSGSVRSLNKSARIFTVWEMIRSEFYQGIKTTGSDILFSGGANSLKGLPRALRAFNEVLNKVDKKLHVIGGGCKWEFVEEVRIRYGLQNIRKDNVILHGGVSAGKIMELYTDCYCLYHPSLIDNSPNSVCEAQLAGLPVVATNTGGLSSLINHGVTGLLLDSDVKNDAGTLLKLWFDNQQRQTISENARSVALLRHDKNSITQQVIEAYDAVKNKTNETVKAGI
ncbi:glycosyltransferase [Pedobacter sp. HMF7647]|uniref:Glycosyltransferase n=1 Tax=Hufsiella arboris TaxID=2695275 RepID=A0A7K1YC14_9SPHI|nr:glycosyltransferase family 4 protein [Hufsiella arboris]MXV52126.1 glycosyltransferase [Hufsiella arboris]